jgi:hypothetical protein
VLLCNAKETVPGVSVTGKRQIYRSMNRHKIIRGILLFFFMFPKEEKQTDNYRLSLTGWEREEICEDYKINKINSITVM